MIKESRFVIAVPDLMKSAEFYEKVLGFSISEFGDPGWRIYIKDSCKIMAGECPDAPALGEMGDHSYFCYLEVENVDEYFSHVAKNEVEILKELSNEPWGMREFAVKTIDGHRIMIGQDLD